jgi:hypothetical protein
MQIAEKQPQSLGGIINRLSEIKAERAELSKQDKALKDEFTDLEAALLAALDAEESTMAAGSFHKAVVSEEEVMQLEDFETFWEFCKDQDAGYLFQRRFNNSAWRELRALLGQDPPGTKPFTRRSISLTKL